MALWDHVRITNLKLFFHLPPVKGAGVRTTDLGMGVGLRVQTLGFT